MNEFITKHQKFSRWTLFVVWVLLFVQFFIGPNLHVAYAALILSTAALTMSFTLSNAKRAAEQDAVKHLEALQMTYRTTVKICESADYRSAALLEQALRIAPKSEETPRDYTHLKAALQSLNKSD